jgi:hypothetical protein
MIGRNRDTEQLYQAEEARDRALVAAASELGKILSKSFPDELEEGDLITLELVTLLT